VLLGKPGGEKFKVQSFGLQGADPVRPWLTPLVQRA